MPCQGSAKKPSCYGKRRNGRMVVTKTNLCVYVSGDRGYKAAGWLLLCLLQPYAISCVCASGIAKLKNLYIIYTYACSCHLVAPSCHLLLFAHSLWRAKLQQPLAAAQLPHGRYSEISSKHMQAVPWRKCRWLMWHHSPARSVLGTCQQGTHKAMLLPVLQLALTAAISHHSAPATAPAAQPPLAAAPHVGAQQVDAGAAGTAQPLLSLVLAFVPQYILPDALQNYCPAAQGMQQPPALRCALPELCGAQPRRGGILHLFHQSCKCEEWPRPGGLVHPFYHSCDCR